MTNWTFAARVMPALALLFGLSACAHTGGTGEVANGEAARDDASNRSAVTAEDIERSPNQPIEQILAGRVSGVTVTRTGDGIAVRIRGTTSISGGNEPLYVINGTPVQPGPGGGLSGINPYEIESIEVLKDAADTAMYGMRGANGVIVIRLKQPGH